MPKKSYKKDKRNNVRFVFTTHPHTDKRVYLPQTLLKGAKTIVYERAGGIVGRPRSFTPSPTFLQIWEEGAKYGEGLEKTEDKFLLNAIRKGIRVVPGELVKTKADFKKLNNLWGKEFRTYGIANARRRLKDIKSFFQAALKFEKERHKIIRETIKKSRKPLAARYGIFHSLLSRELQKEGIESVRKILPQVFDWELIVSRKLMVGLRPTDLEYKKGFISKAWGKHDSYYENKLSDKELRFSSLIETTLLNLLTEKQIDKIILHGYGEDIPKMVYKFNGLPENPTRKQLEEFLEKHSSFYRRQLSHEEGLRKLKEEKNRKRK